MNRQKELAMNTAILTVGKFLTKFINFILLPLYTTLLSTDEYGTYDLLVTYGTLLLPLVNWQFDQGIFRFVLDCRTDQEKQKVIFSTLFTSSILQCIFYSIFFYLLSLHLYIKNAYFLLIYVILHVFTTLFLQFLRGLGYNIKYAVASFISASSITVFNVFTLVFLKMGLQGMLISTLAGQLLTLIYLIIESKCWKFYSVKCIDKTVFRVVGNYSFPLIPNNLAWWVVNASDRTIISYFLGTSVNGIYSVANKFPNVFIQFYNILNLSWTETVSLHFQDEDRDEFLTETMTSLFKMFSGACFGIVACIPFIFPLLVNKEYVDAYNQILLLMYAMLFRVLVGLYSCVYVAQKKAKKIAYTSFLAAAINIIIDFALINKVQIYAASISTLVSFSSMFFIRYIDVNKIIHMKIEKQIVFGSLIVGGMQIFTYYSGNIKLQGIALVITIIYVIRTNIDMIKAGIRLMRQKLKPELRD